MDEGTLNDLLECSVCFDRLDTSSKVLPCQHTFCRNCLHDIVRKQKELRCPECRVLVTVKVEELPPNVLLMRILEGMKNAVPKKQPRAPKNAAQQHQPAHQGGAAPAQHLHGTPDRKTNNKQSLSPIVSHQPYAKAIYDFEAKEAGDLHFKRGDIIFLKKRVDVHWFQGECNGKQGLFPVTYVQVITPLPSLVPQCKALYAFQTNKQEEEGCLTFKEADIIDVIRRVDENWAEGKLEGRIGIFPITFVEMNNPARSLMKLSTNSQPGPSRVAPPTPTTDDSTPLIPTDHSRVVKQQNLHQAVVTSDSSSTFSSGSSSTTTPIVSSSNTSSNSSTAPSSPASPPPRAQPAPPRNLLPNVSSLATPQRSPNATAAPHHSHNKEKRHSFSSLNPIAYNKSTQRHSAEILSSETQSQPASGHSHHFKRPTGPIADDLKLPAPFLALYPYKPQKPDELELRKGGLYTVTERCQDGWYKGTSNRTQKCGVFPGNYVGYAGKLTATDKGVSYARKGAVSASSSARGQGFINLLPPELPPRAPSPLSASWHGQQDNASLPLGRSSSAVLNKSNEKTKDRKDKGSVGLMRRLASIKRSKSPPGSSYSMDNPVFEDVTTQSVNAAQSHPVHVRSGSCPSQLLQLQPVEHHRLFGSTSQRLKHKERPSVLSHNMRGADNPTGSSSSSLDVPHHRKSNSLDAGNHRSKTSVQTVNELFRCEIPYPPLSEYELELQKDDLIYVHKKREDGWYKGTLQRNGRTGLFPANFVKPAK